MAIRFPLGSPLWGSCHEVTERVKVACPTPSGMGAGYEGLTDLRLTARDSPTA